MICVGKPSLQLASTIIAKRKLRSLSDVTTVLVPQSWNEIPPMSKWQMFISKLFWKTASSKCKWFWSRLNCCDFFENKSQNPKGTFNGNSIFFLPAYITSPRYNIGSLIFIMKFDLDYPTNGHYIWIVIPLGPMDNFPLVLLSIYLYFCCLQSLYENFCLSSSTYLIVACAEFKWNSLVPMYSCQGCQWTSFWSYFGVDGGCLNFNFQIASRICDNTINF